VVSDPGAGREILAAAGDRMQRLGIAHVTFQLEPTEKIDDCRLPMAD
jgi:hypothetical protein